MEVPMLFRQGVPAGQDGQVDAKISKLLIPPRFS